MQKSTLKLLAPLLVLLVPLALLVRLGTEYLSTIAAERERNLQEQARLLLEGKESELSRRIQGTATTVLESLRRRGEAAAVQSGSRALEAAREEIQSAERRITVAGVFLISRTERGSQLLYPAPSTPSVVGRQGAEFPFEMPSTAALRREWVKLNQVVDGFIQSGSPQWALEAIRERRQGTLGQDPEGRAFLAYMEGTVLSLQGQSAQARKVFLDLVKALESWPRQSRRRGRRPPGPPQREILFLRYQAAIQAEGSTRVEELLGLAEGIAGGRWNNVPEEFLKFLFHQKILEQLNAAGSPAVRSRVEQAILPAEQERENRRAFLLFMYGGKSEVLEALDRRTGPSTDDMLFLDTTMGDKPLVLAFRTFKLPTARLIAGLAIDLERLAAQQLQVANSAAEEDAPDRLLVTLQTPYNQPVLTRPGSAISTSPSVVSVRALSAPLQGFRLQALLENPEANAARIADDQLKLGLYLATLGLMAGGGAFILLRNVRREMELARIKSEFVSRVTHDLKTPLALIRLYGETLSLGRAREEGQAENCGRIITSECDTLNGMIERVLTFSRIERGLLNYDPVPGRLDRETDKILDLFAPEARYKKVELDREVEEVPEFAFDREGYRRTLLNLLDNASKFGGGSATVRLESVDSTVRLEVMDRGPGIAEEDLARIFQPFHRGRSAGEKRGSGLGLSLVKHFAGGHGGSVQVLPREGGGTIMRLILPIRN